MGKPKKFSLIELGIWKANTHTHKKKTLIRIQKNDEDLLQLTLIELDEIRTSDFIVFQILFLLSSII